MSCLLSDVKNSQVNYKKKYQLKKKNLILIYSPVFIQQDNSNFSWRCQAATKLLPTTAVCQSEWQRNDCRKNITQPPWICLLCICWGKVSVKKKFQWIRWNAPRTDAALCRHWMVLFHLHQPMSKPSLMILMLIICWPELLSLAQELCCIHLREAGLREPYLICKYTFLNYVLPKKYLTKNRICTLTGLNVFEQTRCALVSCSS